MHKYKGILANKAAALDVRQAIVTAHVDGDTFHVEIPFDLPRWAKETEITFRPVVRFSGIDAPAYDKNDPQSAGKPAADFVASKTPVGTQVQLRIKPYRDLYGRIYAEVWSHGEDKSLNQQLLDAGLATAFKDLEEQDELT